jgi:hypothetical protein
MSVLRAGDPYPVYLLRTSEQNRNSASDTQDVNPVWQDRDRDKEVQQPGLAIAASV